DSSLSLGFDAAAAKANAASPVTIKVGVLNAGALTIQGNAFGLARAADERSPAAVTFNGTLAVSGNQSVQLIKGLTALATFGHGADARLPSVWSHLAPLPLTVAGSLSLDRSDLKISAKASLGQTHGEFALVQGRKDSQVDFYASSDLVYLDEMLDLSHHA